MCTSVFTQSSRFSCQVSIKLVYYRQKYSNAKYHKNSLPWSLVVACGQTTSRHDKVVACGQTTSRHDKVVACGQTTSRHDRVVACGQTTSRHDKVVACGQTTSRHDKEFRYFANAPKNLERLRVKFGREKRIKERESKGRLENPH